MHITEFFVGFRYQEPSLEKIRYIAETIGVVAMGHPHFAEAKRLFLTHTAVDNYMASLLGRSMAQCRYVNYPMSALINFSAHQLTMRRFPHNGSQKLVQIGCFTGEEFLVGAMRNISLECHLIANPLFAIESSTIAENGPAWEGKVNVMRMPVEEYLKRFSPRIGTLVLANLGLIPQYRDALMCAWGYLDQHADIIACGDFRHLSGLREALLKDGIACTDMFLREQHSDVFEDSGILLIRKQNINYLDIIMHDDR
jgi:hypothetical protein